MRRAALRYEIAVFVHTTRIVWVSGPWAAGSNGHENFLKPGCLTNWGKENSFWLMLATVVQNAFLHPFQAILCLENLLCCVRATRQ